MDEMREFKCRQGHVLGVVIRNGRGIKRLLVYRQAVDPENYDKSDPPDVMAVVDGPLFDLRCSVCEDIRSWMPGEAELAAILERYQRQQAAIIGEEVRV